MSIEVGGGGGQAPLGAGPGRKDVKGLLFGGTGKTIFNC